MKLLNSFLTVILTLVTSLVLFGQQTINQVFDTPGAGNWFVPCDATNLCITVIGGGGSGGGANGNAGGGSLGGGGGGGAGGAAWCCPNPASYTTGTEYVFNIGAGGAPAAPGVNGNWGGQSTVGIPATPVQLYANGGGGGLSENNFAGGGTGGTASNYCGFAYGNTGNTGNLTNGGNGGSAGSAFGGVGGPGGGPAVPGGIGGNYGAGGGGGGPKSGGVNTSGGAGANGAVIFTYDLPFDAPDAGPDQSLCGGMVMAANPAPAAYGYTGQWYVVSNTDPPNPPVISNVNDPNATVTILNPGNCVVLEWRFEKAGCATFVDQVQVCYPLLCNDDPCGALPLPVNVGPCLYQTESLGGATATTSTVEPGCGSWSDNDGWFEVTVPPSGVVTVQATDPNGSTGSALEMGMAIYEGPDCNNLTHTGCDVAADEFDYAEITYVGTPGSTIWVRIWDANELEDFFDICAFTSANPAPPITSGNTTVTCGSTLNFTDPGGPSGNYQDNTGATYILCPDTPGQYVSVDFSTGPFALEAGGNDFITIVDGAADSSVMVAQYQGTTNPGVITSSAPDGCLTVIFASDVAITASGWNATVSCSAVPGVNDTLCSPTNCTGQCGQWICEDGLYPTTNDGNAAEDLVFNNAGCFTSTGEIATKWFYFTALTGGSIEFSFNGPNGQDYNLAIWGPSTSGQPPCPQNTDQPPIRCSMADVQNTGNPVGLSQTLAAGENYEGLDGDGWVDALYVNPGETYAMLMNIYQNGNPQPVIDMTIGGTGTLDCLPVYLPVTLISFDGMNQGSTNLLHWATNSETDNDYFTIERSVNGFDWEVVGTVDGSGTTSSQHFYELRDNTPYFPVTYYRLKQTDYNGIYEYFDVISVNADKAMEGDLISNVFPNPAESYVTFTYTGFDSQTALNVQVVDHMGSVVMNEDFNTFNGMPSTLRVDDLAKGVYQMVFTQGDRRVVKKLSIIK